MRFAHSEGLVGVPGVFSECCGGCFAPACFKTPLSSMQTAQPCRDLRLQQRWARVRLWHLPLHLKSGEEIVCTDSAGTPSGVCTCAFSPLEPRGRLASTWQRRAIERTPSLTPPSLQADHRRSPRTHHSSGPSVLNLRGSFGNRGILVPWKYLDIP